MGSNDKNDNAADSEGVVARQRGPHHPFRMTRAFFISVVVLFAFLMQQNSHLFPCYGTAIEKTNIESPKHEPADVSSSTMSFFDKMHKKLHNAAAVPNHNVERKKYEVGVSMRRGTGGLFDTDRTLLAEIYSSVDSVFEFGLGESTKIAAWVGVKRYVGIDSDAQWVTNTRKEVNMDHFRFIFADIGETGSSGTPKNDKLQKIPLSYQSAPLNDEMEAFDFYLIDGRYRVACACAAMLHAMSRGGDMKKVKFGVHDYPSRNEYHQLESVADIVQESEQLRVFQVKPSTTEQDIYQLWEENIWKQKR